VGDHLSAKVRTYGSESNDPNSPDVEVDARFIDLRRPTTPSRPTCSRSTPTPTSPRKLARKQGALAVEIGRY
jgi:hypothetical protein